MNINYFNGEFSITKANLSEVQPFSHADVTINCDQPLSNTGGILEHKVEKFLSDKLSHRGIKAKWDNSSEGYQLQPRGSKEFPRINKLEMGVDFYI